MTTGHVWNEDLPIYRQIVDAILSRVRDGIYPEGDLLPSVRQLANEFDVNPLTVAKALKEVTQEDLTEKRRGIGMVVKEGAKNELRKRERAKFLREEWPQIVSRIQRMGIDIDTLLDAADLNDG